MIWKIEIKLKHKLVGEGKREEGGHWEGGDDDDFGCDKDKEKNS